jgi:hypothetical protein
MPILWIVPELQETTIIAVLEDREVRLSLPHCCPLMGWQVTVAALLMITAGSRAVIATVHGTGVILTAAGRTAANQPHEDRDPVPERDVRRWRSHLEIGGRLELEDLAEMARLTDGQLHRVERTGLPTDTVRRHRELLRLYAVLNEFQRAMLEGPGLRVRELDLPQMDPLTKWKPSSAAGADARLRLRRTPDTAVFSLETDAPAPREERIRLGRRGPKVRA